MKTCFVIMPIGDQVVGGVKVTAAELKRRYDDLIKEALLQAAPLLQIVRADEIAVPGAITTDIMTRLMHSDLVIADVTFPDPNVFYEIGVRHACRTGTIIIKDMVANSTPFDISHQRYISYENTPTGMKSLAKNFRQYLDFFTDNPDKPDNQLLELASLTNYAFPNYKKPVALDPLAEAALAIVNFPEALQVLGMSKFGNTADLEKLLRTALTKTDKIMTLINALHKTGELADILLQVSQLPLAPATIPAPVDSTSPLRVPRLRKKK